MACEFCNRGNEKNFFTGPVIEINNPESLVLFRKVVIPTSMGDETAFPPINGKYHNVLLHYDINGHNYIYSSDGIPTLIEAEIPEEIYDRLDTLDREMAAEVEARTAADIAIEAEIEEIKNSPDVVDIVATYAALQAYDTSHLGDKDIIRVLTDETHDGASSYYRWDKQTETWTYIGSIQTAANTIFYADLSETGNTRHIYKNSDMTGTMSVQELLDANEDGQVILRMSSAQTPENFNDAYLQNTYVGVGDYQFLFLDNRNYYEYDGTATTDTSYYYSKSTIQLELTAGNNITITGNTNSATDTTYSNFTGATTQQAGTSGLVPAPTTSDPDKYLKGDGSWGTPTGTTYTAGANVTIGSGNVISATDTTYSDFVGTNGQTAGTNGLVPAPATTDAGKFLNASGAWQNIQVGAAKVLTTDDYNWNWNTQTTTNPNAVALWLLPAGIYTKNDDSLKLYVNKNLGADQGIFIVGQGEVFPVYGKEIRPIIRFDYTGQNGVTYGIWVEDGAQFASYSLITLVEDDLTGQHRNWALSAYQGRVLKNLIDGLVISGAGAPTAATVGTVGKLYEDKTNGSLYICTDATDPYVWEEVGGGAEIATFTTNEWNALWA